MDLAYGVFLTVMDVLVQRWKQHNLPPPDSIGGDVKDHTIIITGPTSGIGEKVAEALSRRGARVILACRNTSKGQAMKDRLEKLAKQSGSKAPMLEVQKLDVSSLASIREFAKRWADSGRKLDCLINNAGILSILGKRQLTVDGFEAHMCTNFLGPSLLTLLLLPALERAGSPQAPSRVVMVSTVVHFCCTSLPTENMSLERRFSALRAYGQSKYAQVTLTAELRRRLPQDGRVAVLACHPGECSTDIVRTLPPFWRRLNDIIIPPLLVPIEKAASSTLYCATSNPVSAKLHHKDPHQCYIGCGCRLEAPATGCTDPDQGAWLWDYCCNTLGLEEFGRLKRQ